MIPIALNHEQRLDWLRLIRSENVGPRTFRDLINRFGGAAAALEALPALARKGGKSGIKVASRDEVLREMDRATRLGIRFVAAGESDYPSPLAVIDTAPPMIGVKGMMNLSSKPMVSIVGSRNSSAAGLAFTEKLAAGLGEAGFVVVSGLARGIDTKAHRAALRTGTVAVLAGGHERIYPSENEKLLDQIVDEGGAALSEMPLEWEPRARDFPRRNRIVSGLSYGTIVVEAARRSGSLITARFALEQGREVFATPGSPLDPRAEGTNDLIRDGATLCARLDDVISVLEPLLGIKNWMAEGISEGNGADQPLWDELDGYQPLTAPMVECEEPGLDAQSVLLSLLGPSPVTIDELIRLSLLSARSVQTLLLELELAGKIERDSGRTVVLKV
jgi:DNA processing protein